MKPLVIYHADCADGFGAAFAAWLKLGDEAEYRPMPHGKDLEPLPAVSGREVYILDFSFPRQIMEYIFEHAKHVVWLDHHKTAFEMWCPREHELFVNKNLATNGHYTLLDNSKSGALLAWEYFHQGTEVPMLIRHIDDQDRWQFKLPGTKEFNAAIWSHAPWSFEQWENFLEETGFSANDGTGIDAWYREGAAILRAHNQQVQAAVEQARACVIEIDADQHNHEAPKPWRYMSGRSDGQPFTESAFFEANGLAVNCPPNLSSDVGHELANQSGTFGLCWSLDAGNVVRCSLRSNGDYDVSAVAKAFGGGGHRNAARFSTDINTLMGWLKLQKPK